MGLLAGRRPLIVSPPTHVPACRARPPFSCRWRGPTARAPASWETCRSATTAPQVQTARPATPCRCSLAAAARAAPRMRCRLHVVSSSHSLPARVVSQSYHAFCHMLCSACPQRHAARARGGGHRGGPAVQPHADRGSQVTGKMIGAVQAHARAASCCCRAAPLHPSVAPFSRLPPAAVLPCPACPLPQCAGRPSALPSASDQLVLCAAGPSSQLDRVCDLRRGLRSQQRRVWNTTTDQTRCAARMPCSAQRELVRCRRIHIRPPFPDASRRSRRCFYEHLGRPCSAARRQRTPARQRRRRPAGGRWRSARGGPASWHQHGCVEWSGRIRPCAGGYKLCCRCRRCPVLPSELRRPLLRHASLLTGHPLPAAYLPARLRSWQGGLSATALEGLNGSRQETGFAGHNLAFRALLPAAGGGGATVRGRHCVPRAPGLASLLLPCRQPMPPALLTAPTPPLPRLLLLHRLATEAAGAGRRRHSGQRDGGPLPQLLWGRCLRSGCAAHVSACHPFLVIDLCSPACLLLHSWWQVATRWPATAVCAAFLPPALQAAAAAQRQRPRPPHALRPNCIRRGRPGAAAGQPLD